MRKIYRNHKVVGNKELLTDYKSYAFYRDKAKYRNKKNTPNFVAYSGVLNSIYEKVAESIPEYEGGVYANNFFYIIPQALPKKSLTFIPSKDGLKSTLNSHSDGKIYKILFINLLLEKKYQVWDAMFFNSVKQKVSQKIRDFYVNYKFVLNSIMTTRRAK